MFTVQKIQGVFAVINWNDEIEIAYKNKKHAEDFARGATLEILNSAERENERRDGIATYLATRAARPAPAASAQLEFAL